MCESAGRKFTNPITSRVFLLMITTCRNEISLPEALRLCAQTISQRCPQPFLGYRVLQTAYITASAAILRSHAFQSNLPWAGCVVIIDQSD